MKLPVDYHDTHFKERKKVREEYVRRQRGMCWFCGARLSQQPTPKITEANINKDLFPAGFFNWPVHLHHDRNTGLTIGAVHARCNAFLWQHLGE